MKKLLAALLAMVLLLASTSVAASAFTLKTDDGQISAGDIFGETGVYFADAAVNTGSTVTVDLKTLNNTGFTSLTVVVAADAGLALAGVANGTGTVVTKDGDTVTITAATTITTDVVVAKLTFSATTAGTKTVDLTVTGTNGAEALDVKGSVCSVVVTDAQAPAAVQGDVDGSGKVDTQDLVLLKQVLANLVDQTDARVVNPNVDQDAEGKVDTLDLVYLKKMLAGLI